MTRFARFTTLATALCLVALPGAAWAEEEEIAFEKLPRAVRKAIHAKFPKAEIKLAIEEEEEDGETTYEVSLVFKGHAFDVALKPSGAILEIEKQIELEELPKAVKQALAARHPEAKIEKVEMVTKGGGPAYYELVVTTELVFTAKGKIVEAGKTEESDEKPHAKGKKSRKESEDEMKDDDDDKKSSAKAKKSRKGGKEDEDDDKD
jgi:hypothetical protein